MKEKKYQKQVSNDHYIKQTYGHIYRWISYYHQLDSVFSVAEMLTKEHGKISVLEIGPGDKTVSTMLKHNKFKLKTMDIASDINPDILASLPDLPIKKVDIILCCEVLEHIEYDDVVKSLENMSKKSKFTIISVPHKSLYLSFMLRLPIIKPLRFLIDIPTPFISHKFDGQHYWELGANGYSVSRFKKTLKDAGLECFKDFRVSEFPYHHFFLTESN